MFFPNPKKSVITYYFLQSASARPFVPHCHPKENPSQPPCPLHDVTDVLDLSAPHRAPVQLQIDKIR